MKEKRVIPALWRRNRRDAFAVAPATERIVLLKPFHPTLHRERRIGEAVVEGFEVRVVNLVLRIGYRVAVLEFGIVNAVNDHRHFRHTDGRKIELLAFNGNFVERTSRFRRGTDQKRSRTARHVISGNHRTIVLGDVHDPRHYPAHFSRGVELAFGLP